MPTILELHSVFKSFGALLVLNDLSFTVAEGEVLGIMGPNGAGKTTMLNLIAGDLPVSAGQVWFQGQDITHEPVARRCHAGIGRTSQIPRPFSGMSTFENVLIGATYGQGLGERASYELCRDILHLTGLFDRRDVLAGNLRLLERKRLELARALATNPTLLLIDEIAGGLTEPEVLELLELMAHIRAQGVTIIWIEHVVHALASSVDRILVINFGTLLVEGPPQEVLERPEFQEVYFGV